MYTPSSLQVWYREPMTILPVVLAVGVIALWGVAFYFFILKASTNWQVSDVDVGVATQPVGVATQPVGGTAWPVGVAA